MKIFTEKKYEELIRSIKANSYNEGYERGLHEGMITDKRGMCITTNGIYHFDDGNLIQATYSNKRSKINIKSLFDQEG